MQPCTCGMDAWHSSPFSEQAHMGLVPRGQTWRVAPTVLRSPMACKLRPAAGIENPRFATDALRCENEREILDVSFRGRCCCPPALNCSRRLPHERLYVPAD